MPASTMKSRFFYYIINIGGNLLGGNVSSISSQGCMVLVMVVPEGGRY